MQQTKHHFFGRHIWKYQHKVINTGTVLYIWVEWWADHKEWSHLILSRKILTCCGEDIVGLKGLLFGSCKSQKSGLSAHSNQSSLSPNPHWPKREEADRTSPLAYPFPCDRTIGITPPLTPIVDHGDRFVSSFGFSRNTETVFVTDLAIWVPPFLIFEMFPVIPLHCAKYSKPFFSPIYCSLQEKL